MPRSTWDVASGRLIHELKGHTLPVFGVAFSPDGLMLATTSYDESVRLWNPITGQAGPTLAGHTDIVYAARFSPDGRTLVTAGGDSTSRLWDTATGACRHVLAGHEGIVSCAAFSPDGSQLAAFGAHVPETVNPGVDLVVVDTADGNARPIAGSAVGVGGCGRHS